MVLLKLGKGFGSALSWFLVLFWIFSNFIAAVNSLSSDGFALLALKSSFDIGTHGLLSDWKIHIDPCSWEGVGCDSASRVVSLNITGKLSNKISPCSNATEDCKNCNVLKSVFENPSSLTWSCLIATKSTTPKCYLKGKLSPAIGNLTELRVLSLPYNCLSGNIPKQLAALRFLEKLELQGNAFSGPIPGELGALSELKVLNLAFNGLDAGVPETLSGCRNLNVLDFSGNMLSGELPKFFRHLPELQVLALSSNGFVGTIPDELTQHCQNLKILLLDDNFLTGSIPEALGNCSSLISLIVSKNLLSGHIPAQIGELQNLRVLDVSQNSLGGQIPNELVKCSKLSVLILTNILGTSVRKQQSYRRSSVLEINSYEKCEFNLFNSIPTFLMSLTNLQILWAPGASTAGNLPSHWESCQSLEMVNLAGNFISGSFPEGLTECKRLIYLDLSLNNLSGNLPQAFSPSCMVMFNVSGNSIAGFLPVTNIGSCSSSQLLEPHNFVDSVPWSLDESNFTTWATHSYFKKLYCRTLSSNLPTWFQFKGITVVHDMSNNNFTGPLLSMTVGKTLIEKSAVYGLFLFGNQLSGIISSTLFESCQMFKALSVKISSNKFQGSLPSNAMGKCMSLKQFEAANNMLVGKIQHGLSKMKRLVSLDLSSNRISGKLPMDIVELQELQYLKLAHNQLTGNIPQQIGELSSLVTFDVSSNMLTGSIPGTLANLSNLKELYLSNNYLSGIIPQNITNLKNLSLMDVKFNNLSGSLPYFRSLALYKSVDTTGNKLLTSSAVAASSPSDVSNQAPLPYATNIVVKQNRHPNSIVIAAITSGCAIAAVLIILVVLFNCTKPGVRRRTVEQIERKEVVIFRRPDFLDFQLTYDNVVAATGNFSVNNLIGNGGFGATYRAQLQPGLMVAVKRLAIGRFQGTQQFEAEVRTLGRVQHQNLVTLIGYYASSSEMFLIYNYLPGGNLESLIHDTRRGFVCWRVRYKIALDIAQALAYLHDECTPKVLHRDIKPSNVLLDNNSNAFLSDFGLARLLNASETHATTDVAGTFGYVAPEYALTCRLSDKADVYSYGVVLLELLSGKRALDPYFSNYGHGFNIVAWACQLYQKGKPAEVFATGLWEHGPRSELLSVLKLAVKCTMASLAIRPTMREVVEVLKAVR